MKAMGLLVIHADYSSTVNCWIKFLWYFMEHLVLFMKFQIAYLFIYLCICLFIHSLHSISHNPGYGTLEQCFSFLRAALLLPVYSSHMTISKMAYIRKLNRKRKCILQTANVHQKSTKTKCANKQWPAKHSWLTVWHIIHDELKMKTYKCHSFNTKRVCDLCSEVTQCM